MSRKDGGGVRDRLQDGIAIGPDRIWPARCGRREEVIGAGSIGEPTLAKVGKLGLEGDGVDWGAVAGEEADFIATLVEAETEVEIRIIGVVQARFGIGPGQEEAVRRDDVVRRNLELKLVGEVISEEITREIGRGVA